MVKTRGCEKLQSEPGWAGIAVTARSPFTSPTFTLSAVEQSCINGRMRWLPGVFALEWFHFYSQPRAQFRPRVSADTYCTPCELVMCFSRPPADRSPFTPPLPPPLELKHAKGATFSLTLARHTGNTNPRAAANSRRGTRRKRAVRLRIRSPKQASILSWQRRLSITLSPL